MGLTPAALGQRIKQLEVLFETALFLRTTRRVELTEAGQALRPQATKALAAARACHPESSPNLLWVHRLCGVAMCVLCGVPRLEDMITCQHVDAIMWYVAMTPFC